MSADLFNLTPADLEQVRREAKRARRRESLIGRMLTMYGEGPAGATCGQCRNLQRYRGSSKLWSKCALGPQSGGPATDWRSRWPACGKFEVQP